MFYWFFILYAPNILYDFFTMVRWFWYTNLKLNTDLRTVPNFWMLGRISVKQQTQRVLLDILIYEPDTIRNTVLTAGLFDISCAPSIYYVEKVLIFVLHQCEFFRIPT